MMRYKNFAIIIATFLVAIAVSLCDALPVISGELQKKVSKQGCNYYMCQYEKSNIDTIIFEHAKTSQTIMFGEIHDAAIEGMRLPIEDSQYVITLLSKLRKIGYEYLALEVNKNTEEEGHSYDIVSFYKAYIAEGYCHEEEYPNAKPGWIELIKEAIDIGYKIRFIDVFQRNSFSHFPRDEAMFEKIREEIFDEDRNAKIIVYIGANHIGENETQNGIYLYGGKQKPLGYYLNKYTKGNNYSVYMGNTYDSPVGSDLFISYFIWETFHKIDSNNCSE